MDKGWITQISNRFLTKPPKREKWRIGGWSILEEMAAMKCEIEKCEMIDSSSEKN